MDLIVLIYQIRSSTFLVCSLYIIDHSRFKEKYKDTSCFTIGEIERKISRDKGVSIRSRPVSSNKDSYTLGPGQYNPKPIQSSAPAHSFGRMSREVITPQTTTGKVSKGYYTPETSKHKRGYNFGPIKSYQYLKINDSGKFPGPGYYNIRHDIIKPKSISFSIIGSTKYPEVTYSSEAKFIDPVSCINDSGYQKFLKAERFPKKEKFTYTPILFKTRKKDSHIVVKNIKSIAVYNNETKIKQIKQNNELLNMKIQSAQRTKERLMRQAIDKVTNRRKEIDHKILIRKEEANSHKIIYNWIILFSINNLIRQFHSKGILRKNLRKRTSRILRCLFFSLLALGKFRKRLYDIRKSKATQTLRRLLSKHSKAWKEKIRRLTEVRVTNFCVKYSTSSYFKLLTMKIAKRIKVLQRCCRRYLARKHLMLAIMNKQWSLVEHAVIKCKSNEEIIKEPLLSESKVVPLKVRLYFLNKHLKALNDPLMVQLSEYVKTNKRQRVDSGKEMKVSSFRLFISITLMCNVIEKSEMIGLVKNALACKASWKSIITNTPF